jgi:hypothetical protein
MPLSYIPQWVAMLSPACYLSSSPPVERVGGIPACWLVGVLDTSDTRVQNVFTDATRVLDTLDTMDTMANGMVKQCIAPYRYAECHSA